MNAGLSDSRAGVAVADERIFHDAHRHEAAADVRFEAAFGSCRHACERDGLPDRRREAAGKDLAVAGGRRDALAVAEQNAHRTGAVRNLRLVHGSLFAAVGGLRFDLITANPPYIASAEPAELPVDVRDFEPKLALDGGPDGLDLVRQIAAQGEQYLTPGGLLALEIGADQGPATVQILEAHGYQDVELARDLGARDRVVSGRAATSTL